MIAAQWGAAGRRAPPTASVGDSHRKLGGWRNPGILGKRRSLFVLTHLFEPA